MHVWVELNHLNISNVTREDSKWRMVSLVPDASRAVIGTRGEVMPKRSELDVPDWELVAVVDDHARASLDRPSAHSAVLRARQQELVIKADAHSEDRSIVAN